MKKQPGWALPDLKAAQVRTNRQSPIRHEVFTLPEQLRRLGVGKKYYLRTYGCQANERDGETLAGMLELLGFVPTQETADADLILLNTCEVRKNAEDKVLGELGSLKRLRKTNPDVLFALCGCMAQEEAIVTTILEKFSQAIDNENYQLAQQYLHEMKAILGSNAKEVVESQFTLDAEMLGE